MPNESATAYHHFGTSRPDDFVDDGITMIAPLRGIEPIPKEPAPGPSTSGNDRSGEGNVGGNDPSIGLAPALALDSVDLDRTLMADDPRLEEAAMFFQSDATDQHEAELQEKAHIVRNLQEKLIELSVGGVLCTTQLSDEVAAKQEKRDQLWSQLQEKKGSDRQDKVALLQFRREREAEVSDRNEQLVNTRQGFKRELNAICQHTEKIKKQLDNINAAQIAWQEKFEELKKELIDFTAAVRALSDENQRLRDAVAKQDLITRKNKLFTMERLLMTASEIDKKNAELAELKKEDPGEGRSS